MTDPGWGLVPATQGVADASGQGAVDIGGFATPDNPTGSLGFFGDLGSWLQTSGTSDALGKLGSTLQGMGKSGTGSGAGAAGGNPMGNVPNISGGIVHPAQAAFGQSRSPVSLDSLLQLLMARRNAYLAATNPQAAQPVNTALPSGKGLLGL